MNAEEQPKQGFSFGLRNRPWLKAFAAGAAGALPYAMLRAHVQEKQKHNETESRPMQWGEAVQDALKIPVVTGVGEAIKERDLSQLDVKAEPLFTKKATNEYMQFTYSFIPFAVGLSYGKRFLDWLFPDDGKAKHPQKAEEKDGEKPGFFTRMAHGVRDTGKGLLSFTLKYVVGVPLAIIPYSMMGRLMDEKLLVPHEVGDGKDLTGMAKVGHQVDSAVQSVVSDPLGAMMIRVAAGFSTFNVSFQYWHKFVDHLLGQDKPSHEPDRGALGNLAHEVKKTTVGTVLPVAIGVTPLVGALYFSSAAEKAKFEAKTEGRELSFGEQARQAGFEAGGLINQTGQALFHNDVTKQVLEVTGLDDPGKRQVAERMAQFALAYGSYAALRTYVTPFIKSMFGEQHKAEPIIAKAPEAAADPTLAKASTYCGCDLPRAKA